MSRYDLPPQTVEWISENRHLLNREIAKVINRSERSVARILIHLGLKRDKSHLRQIGLQAIKLGIQKAIPDQRGAANPYWRGGRSKDNIYYRKRQLERYPDRCEARRLVMMAVKNGTLTRQPCVICANPKSHGHHQDYAKPLEVIWLCQKCHNGLHSGNLTVEIGGQTVQATPANPEVWNPKPKITDAEISRVIEKRTRKAVV